MKTWHKIILFLIVAVTAAVMLVPWKPWLAGQIKAELAKHGVEADFTIAEMSPGAALFKDISLGPLRAQSVEVRYTLADASGTINWVLQASELVVTQGDIKVVIPGLEGMLSTSDNARKGSGNWNVPSITASGLPLELPPLSASGLAAIAGGAAKLSGALKSADGVYRADFALEVPMEGAAKPTFMVPVLTMPWQGGTLRARNIIVPLSGDAPVMFALEVQEVRLNDLLQVATGNRANATGVVSGTIPVTVARDGTFTLHNGKLSAREAGTVKLQPDVIPGDNPQVALLRDVLQNFHYRDFSLGLDSGEDKKLSMLLSFSGNNPDVYNGREVKLNVRIGGDVLSLLQQSVTTLTDPTKLLEGEHAK